jgi:hypothetical protein
LVIFSLKGKYNDCFEYMGKKFGMSVVHRAEGIGQRAEGIWWGDRGKRDKGMGF